MGLPKPSRETKFSGSNADSGIIFIFPVQLTTRRIGNLLTRPIHTPAICVTIHTYIVPTKYCVCIGYSCDLFLRTFYSGVFISLGHNSFVVFIRLLLLLLSSHMLFA